MKLSTSPFALPATKHSGQLSSSLNSSAPVAPIIVHCDNKSAIAVAEKPSLNQRMKHVAVRYHKAREYVRDKNIKLDYVRSADNVADIFTKPLAKGSFSLIRPRIVQ